MKTFFNLTKLSHKFSKQLKVSAKFGQTSTHSLDTKMTLSSSCGKQYGISEIASVKTIRTPVWTYFGLCFI